MSPPTGSSFSKLFWPFRVPCNYKLILESVCQFLQKVLLGFWLELHWNFRLIFWEKCRFDNIESFNPWICYIFPFILLFNFCLQCFIGFSAKVLYVFHILGWHNKWNCTFNFIFQLFFAANWCRVGRFNSLIPPAPISCESSIKKDL